MMRELIKPTLSLTGDMAEIGVWTGKTARMIHHEAKSKTLHLYDTFKGIVMADSSIDVHVNGDFSNTSIEQVRGNIDGNSQFIVFHEGTFPDTFREHDRKFCFVHSDTDTYFGTKATLDIFPQRMVPGGIIVFHDYEWKGCPGVKKAIDEFLLGKSFKTSLSSTYFSINF